MQITTDTMTTRFFTPRITIVISTFNSMSNGKRLDLTLRSLRAQSLPVWEIIVVDNCSSDRTVELAKQFGCRVFTRRSTIAQAYNIAMENMTGNYVFFLDSDQYLPATFINECARLISNQRVDCVGYTQLMLSDYGTNKIGVLAYLRNLETRLGGEPSDGIYMYSSQSIKGENYDTDIPVLEDYYFRMKILKKHPKVGYVKSLVLHYHDDSLRWSTKRALHYGKIFRYATKRQPQRLRAIRDYFLVTKRSKSGTNLPLSMKSVAVFLPIYLLLKYATFAVGFLS